MQKIQNFNKIQINKELQCQVNKQKINERINIFNLLFYNSKKGLDIDNANNAINQEATDDNDSLNKNNGEGGATSANGSNTPNTAAKQKKMFFNKKVNILATIIINNKLKQKWSDINIMVLNE